jgi:hypothetical protein
MSHSLPTSPIKGKEEDGATPNVPKVRTTARGQARVHAGARRRGEDQLAHAAASITSVWL